MYLINLDIYLTMLAFSHEYIVMRNDFGHLAMTEVELGMPLPPGMNAVV